MSQPSEDAGTEARPLAEAIIALAEAPDDMPGIDVQLKSLVQLAADRVSAADYASVTVLRDDAYSTVAASSAIAEAVDAAQYAEQDGPCLRALIGDAPVTVPDLGSEGRCQVRCRSACQFTSRKRRALPLPVRRRQPPTPGTATARPAGHVRSA